MNIILMMFDLMRYLILYLINIYFKQKTPIVNINNIIFISRHRRISEVIEILGHT